MKLNAVWPLGEYEWDTFLGERAMGEVQRPEGVLNVAPVESNVDRLKDEKSRVWTSFTPTPSKSVQPF
jgi:hypothetical protein